MDALEQAFKDAYDKAIVEEAQMAGLGGLFGGGAIFSQQQANNPSNSPYLTTTSATTFALSGTATQSYQHITLGERVEKLERSMEKMMEGMAEVHRIMLAIGRVNEAVKLFDLMQEIKDVSADK